MSWWNGPRLLWSLCGLLPYATWSTFTMPQFMLQATKPFYLFTGETSPYPLRDFKVFGSLCYILAKCLQDGDSFQKWKSRAWLGMYIGPSNCHASHVPLVYNPQTSHITPQYHVTYDKGFTSISTIVSSSSLECDALLIKLYEKATWLFKSPYSTTDEVYDFSSVWMDTPPTNPVIIGNKNTVTWITLTMILTLHQREVNHLWEAINLLGKPRHQRLWPRKPKHLEIHWLPREHLLTLPLFSANLDILAYKF